ncbi:MAG: CPBP family intramembrane glutamic endopeptidase [Bacteroidota bacterium]
MTIKKQTWFHVIIFFTIATILSGVFRLGLFDWYNKMTLPYGLTIVMKSILEGIGPIAGATIVLLTIKKKSDIIFLGLNKTKSFIMVIIPILLFTIFGANNDQNLNRHYYGFIVGISLALYAVFEEYGWRGFLHNEFTNLKPFLRAIIIGSFWYLWHLSFISNETTVLDELKFFGILIFASWGIGAIAEKTKSVFACACFHLIGSILTFSPLISNSFDNQTRYIIFGICLFSWIIIVNTWEKSIITQK